MIVKGGLFGGGTSVRERGKAEGDGVNMIKVHYVYMKISNETP
jgi:hypothetical protein